MAGLNGEILVVNAGSSSLKLGLFDPVSETQLAESSLDWSRDGSEGVTDHKAALPHLLAEVDLSRVVAVGHRVVHGGTRYQQSMRINESVKGVLRELASLAPLHNPAALAAIEAAEALLPGVPQVAAFDTSFHSTMPPSAYLYAVPYSWYTEWGVRRFGFHGLSHEYCTGRAAAMLDRPAEELRLVTCHLGAGCSLAAVVGGHSVATTMGFTPLEGLMMGTRCGSVDPGLLLHLLRYGYMDLPTLDHVLSQESGLQGVSGLSGDMRDILAARAAGDAQAATAFELYIARLRDGICTMAGAMGGLDALVFTAGIGEHAPAVRGAVADALRWLGVQLDHDANAAALPDADIAAASSPVRVLVVHTREDLMVARQTYRLLSAENAADHR
jgi:acetate kinase